VKHPEISRANDGGEENGRQGSVHDAFSQQLSTRPETLSKVPETIEQESRKRKHLVGARRGDRNVTQRPSVNLNKIIGMRLASFPLSNCALSTSASRTATGGGARRAPGPAPGRPRRRGLLYHSPSDVYHKNRSPDRTRAPRARSRGANRRRRSRASKPRTPGTRGGGRTVDFLKTDLIKQHQQSRTRDGRGPVANGTVVSYSCEDRDL
jgi:hypothetical protein